MARTTVLTTVAAGLSLWSVAAGLSGCGGDGPEVAHAGHFERPQVIATVPANGETEVDPNLMELRAVFDRSMQDGNWSWAFTQPNDFPETTGDAFFEDEARTVNVLPVRLEAGRSYEVWINSQTFQNFKDEAGRPSEPFRLDFTTR